jgi:hypothetical protein
MELMFLRLGYMILEFIKISFRRTSPVDKLLGG